MKRKIKGQEMNEQNLIPNSKRTPEELREITRKGGIASGKARLRKKQGRELLRALLTLPETDPKLREMTEAMGINLKDITNEVVVHTRQIAKAKRKADTQAYKALMQTAGYLAENNVSINNTNKLYEVSAEAVEAASKWSSKK